MTARRALTPAARGVSLAVLAALRGGRVDLADQADGSTLATSTAPDGTVLLHAVLHMPVRGHDPRQLTLPAVAPVPVPAEVPPAPEDTETTRINGLSVGDVVSLDDELVEVMGLDDDGWTWRTVGDDPRTRDEGECLWSEVEHVEGTRWRVRPVETETPAAKAKREKAAKPKRAKATKAPKASAPVEPPQGDDAPEVRLWIREAEWDGLDENTRTEFEEPIGGSGVDWQGREGWVTALVPADEILTALRGMATAVGITLHEGDELPAGKAAKAKPARNVPVPEADNLAVYGERSIVAIIHEGGPWELVWSDALPGHMTYEVAVSSVMAQAHAARVYHRGKRCVRDSRDRGAK